MLDIEWPVSGFALAYENAHPFLRQQRIDCLFGQ
jgi:hypothetical protein